MPGVLDKFLNYHVQGYKPMNTQMGLLSAALPSPAGDVVGLLADAGGYAADPSSLTPARGLLSLAALAPGIPRAKGFDDWRRVIWDDVKRGVFHPEEVAPTARELLAGEKEAKRLFRAMSPNELDAAKQAGAFRPIRKGDNDLYVTADPDRLAGGAYGAKGGGHIVEFDPVPVHKATGRLIDVEEIAAKEIPYQNVRRIWSWDKDLKDHVISWERN